MNVSVVMSVCASQRVARHNLDCVAGGWTPPVAAREVDEKVNDEYALEDRRVLQG